MYLRDLGDTEVGGFGITTPEDLLGVQDIQLVRQACTGASVAFADDAVADFFDRQVDLGRRPEQFGRIWLHTYPGNSPNPSTVDEDTFARVFGRTEWAVMFVVARGGQTYARLRFHAGPGGDVRLPVDVDYTQAFAASNHEAWKEEYLATVEAIDLPLADSFSPGRSLSPPDALDLWDDDWLMNWDRPFQAAPSAEKAQEAVHVV